MGLCEAAPNSAGGSGELITPKKEYQEMPCGNTDLREVGIKLKEQLHAQHSQCCASVGAKQNQGCPGSSLLSWLLKMKAMNQLINFLVFTVSGLQTPGILQDMATSQVESNGDKSPRE